MPFLTSFIVSVKPVKAISVNLYMKKLSDMQTESENTLTYLVTSSVGDTILTPKAPTVYGRFTLKRIPKKFLVVKYYFNFSVN